LILKEALTPITDMGKTTISLQNDAQLLLNKQQIWDGIYIPTFFGQ